MNSFPWKAKNFILKYVDISCDLRSSVKYNFMPKLHLQNESDFWQMASKHLENLKIKSKKDDQRLEYFPKVKCTWFVYCTYVLVSQMQTNCFEAVWRKEAVESNSAMHLQSTNVIDQEQIVQRLHLLLKGHLYISSLHR